MVLAAIVALLLVSCRPSPGTTYSGRATWYTDPSATGTCDLRTGVGTRYVALNSDDFAASESCGGWIQVKGPEGTITVQVVDRCPTCPTHGIDLSTAAFDAIGNPVDGIIPVTWKLVSGGQIGNIAYRVKEGSNPYWLAVQVGNIRNLVATLEIQIGSTWKPMPRQSYNYFLYDPSSPLPSTVKLRATDIWGEQIVTSGVPITGGTVVTAATQFKAH